MSGGGSHNLQSGSLVSQNGKSSNTALVVREVTAEARMETLALKGGIGAPPEDRMAIDGPIDGPGLLDSGVSPMEGAIQNESGSLPAVPRFEEPSSTEVESSPALKEKLSPNSENQKQKKPITQSTPIKKSGRKWKRAARGGEQIQQVRRIASPMQCMLMAGKVGKKTPKSHTSPKVSPTERWKEIERRKPIEILFPSVSLIKRSSFVGWYDLNLEIWESCKESTAEKNEECKEAGEQSASPKPGCNDKIAERDSYGPWMQVSYGRSYRNQFGYSPVGKKSGNQGNGGRQGFGDRQENRSGQASVGVGKPGTFVVKKGADTGKISMKVTPLKNNGKSVSKSLGGSRFSILSDNMEEEINIENRQSMASSSRVLTEISNRVLPTKKQLTPNAYKYLIEPPSVKSSLSKSSKENGTEVRTKKSGKETKKNCLHSFSVQPKSLEEDIEDSEVLQNLHEKMVEIRMAETQHPSVRDQPLQVEEPNPTQGQQQVVVSDESTFEVVASKLKEAMEIVLE
ncbi:hypothetical protein LWI29_022477 [Acer saccharum]|uniref:Uncharacterized protein n=1 Tax=Acer saccharum TaxID=4024 RepID=A0AA39VBJ0_ACESA|nr:hypothetical protein LWI29_022477 [Acer saccharum]